MTIENTTPAQNRIMGQNGRAGQTRRAAILALLGGTAITLAACGKRPGTLRIPPGDDDVVSRNSYPPQEDDL